MTRKISSQISSLYTEGGPSEIALGIWRECWLQLYKKRGNSENGDLLKKYTWARHVESKYYIKKLLNKGIGNDISKLNFRELKNSDTVFILGSGPSINQVSEAKWAHISNNDSIGLNKWPFHEFTPTFHVFEFPRRKVSPNDNSHWYWDLLNYRKQSYSNMPIIMKDVSRRYYEIQPEAMPNWVCENIYLLPKIDLPSENIDSPSTWFNQIDNTNFLNSDIKYIYQNNSSLMFLILLSIKMGYKSIVLCGVDLTQSGYFFQNEKYTNIVGHPYKSESHHSSRLHKTACENKKDFTIMEIIDSMKRTILEPRGVSIYVENKNSALYPNIPHYNIKNIN